MVGHNLAPFLSSGALPSQGFPDGSAGKESTCNAEDPSSIPGSGRATGVGTGYPLQYWVSLVAQLVKNLSAMWETWVGDLGSIPGLGRSLEEGKGYPLQYSGLENSMHGIVREVTKSWTRLSDVHTCVTESSSCTPKTHKTLKINSTTIQNKN